MVDRPRLFGLTVAVLVTAAVLLFIAGPAPEQQLRANGSGGNRLITVHGEGLVRAEADVARVVLEIGADGTTAQAARANSSAASQAVIQALRSAGIARGQINMIGIHLGPSSFDGGAFHGVQVFEIEVHDLNRLSDVLDVALSHGATAVRSIAYGLKREAELQQQAVDRAIRDARNRAQAAASAGGVVLLNLRELTVNAPVAWENTFSGPGQTELRASVEAVFDAQ